MKNLLEKLFLGLVCVLVLLAFFSGNSLAITAEECEVKLGKRQLSLEEAKECETILNKLYREVGEQKRSLQSEIIKFNAAIAITTTRIYTTIGQIEELEKEIATLTAKIGRLDVSLDQLSEILIKRIAETYKKEELIL